MSDFIKAAENAFRAFAREKVTLPPKTIFQVCSGVMAMIPAFVDDPDALAIKVANARKGNVAKGLPRATSQVFLYDSHTGLPLALMDSGSITGMRTGAAGGVAAKYLARPDSRREDIAGELGQVITGEVEGWQNEEQVTVFDSTGVAVQDALAARMIYQVALDKGLGRRAVL